MANDDTALRLRGLIEQYMGVEQSKIEDESHLMDDLGIDSLDKVELIMLAEDEFDVEIGDDDAKRVETFADCVKLIDDSRL